MNLVLIGHFEKTDVGRTVVRGLRQIPLHAKSGLPVFNGDDLQSLDGFQIVGGPQIQYAVSSKLQHRFHWLPLHQIVAESSFLGCQVLSGRGGGRKSGPGQQRSFADMTTDNNRPSQFFDLIDDSQRPNKTAQFRYLDISDELTWRSFKPIQILQGA